MKEMQTRKEHKKTDWQTGRNNNKQQSIQIQIEQASTFKHISRKKSIYSAFGYRISLDHATGMEAALACVMRSQQQLRWRQKGLEKQCTEFNTRNITLRCEYKHRANPSQIVSKNIPEGSCLTCKRGADWKHRLASQSYLKAHLFLTFFSRNLTRKSSENKISDPMCNL